MSNIHYFQRYSSKENWVTNATLLLLSRLYSFNRLKFESALNTILGDEEGIDTSVRFGQQEGGSGAKNVIDGIIEQFSFRIAIETKLYDNFDLNQLIRHLESLNGPASIKVLLGLSKSKMQKDFLRKVKSAIAASTDDPRIKFISTTYADIIECIQMQLTDFDIELQDILDDYAKLCEEHGLIDLKERTLLVVSAGNSLKENIKYNIYYNPVARNHNRPFKYLGLYYGGDICAIGECQISTACNLIDGELQFENSDDERNLSVHQKNRIMEVIKKTEYYNLASGLRFFLIDKFHEVSIPLPKVVRQKKYFVFDQNIENRGSLNIAYIASQIKASYSKDLH